LLIKSDDAEFMDVEVVLRVKWHNYRAVVVNTPTHCIASLLGTHNVAELNENLAVRAADQRCVG